MWSRTHASDRRRESAPKGDKRVPPDAIHIRGREEQRYVLAAKGM
jgi:hypothetical protein